MTELASGFPFVVQVDMPSIKQYVFGTDPLNEVRGASAILDLLNRQEMERVLRDRIGGLVSGATVERVYANGGSGQFLVRGCDESAVDSACQHLARFIRRETGGEVRTVYGIAATDSSVSYREALRRAHFQLRCQREFGSVRLVPATMPLVMECASASHLPAMHRIEFPDGVRVLSEASHRKARRGRKAREQGAWAEWMRCLQSEVPWPVPKDWNSLRCASLVDIGRRSSNQVGVVYADGNAMGRLIRAIDTASVFREFSRIVDESIREACFAGLRRVCEREVSRVSDALGDRGQCESLPCDILLLGGDDLLVAVPANRALDFAHGVTVDFERRAARKIEELADPETQRFFGRWLGNRGLSISCGVSISKGTYPFYLSLDLAEQLLKNAKRNPGHGSASGADVARIDFHRVAGSTSQDIRQIRERDYLALDDDSPITPRTLRPLSCSQLKALRASVWELRDAGFPRSKLKALHDAALMENEHRAESQIRDIFARAQHSVARSERQALWNAVSRLCPDGCEFDFPWFRDGQRRMLCVADIIDAYDLFEDRGEFGS